MFTEKPNSPDLWRLIAIALVITFGFSVVFAQLVRYQIGMHKELAEIAMRQREQERSMSPVRGSIFDTKGRLLASNLTEWDISVSPPLVSNPDEVAAELSSILDLPEEDLHGKLTRGVSWLPLANNVPQDIGETIWVEHHDGITCEPQQVRVYPEGPLLAHVLGLVTESGDGFIGIEGYYNLILSGVDGREEVEKSPVGDDLPTPPHAQDPPKAGADLVLTIDSNVQFIAMEELHRALETYGAESGTVVIMRPKTGAILAIASEPTYNPNKYDALDSEHLADPSVSSMWEPGSIFKIITWSAALDAGVITPDMTIYDDGMVEVGGRVIRNSDRQGHGEVTMVEALIKSLNTVAAYISTTLGKDRFYSYLRRYGFGNLTDIDLASEGPGMVKLPGDPNWFPSELGTNSFGQGIAVTPMQMITAVAAVANRGRLMKPYVVQQIITVDEETGETNTVDVGPKVVRNAISQDAAETMVWMLTKVIEEGATKAQVPGYRVAGKTGTAQIPTAYGYHPTDTIASFVGFAPADDPQFIVLVKLDRPKQSPWGSQTAAPTFRAIAERLFVYMQIPPDEIRLAQR